MEWDCDRRLQLRTRKGRRDFGNNGNWTVMKPVTAVAVGQWRRCCQSPFSLERDRRACALRTRPNREERRNYATLMTRNSFDLEEIMTLDRRRVISDKRPRIPTLANPTMSALLSALIPTQTSPKIGEEGKSQNGQAVAAYIVPLILHFVNVRI